MNKVKIKTAILMMQKNETELLNKWIIYHSELFGLTNLHVFDNGSDDDQARELLLDWQQKGLMVDWNNATKQDFENKGKILGDKILSLEKSGAYDCFIPLDCDEFLAVQLDNGQISCEAEDICAELSRHTDCEDLLLIDAQFFNSPISKKLYHRSEVRKCIFMKCTFKSMSVGFHRGKVKNSNEEKKTNLIQFHFHNKPFVLARAQARNKLTLRVKSFDKDYLSTYIGKGRHLTKYFLLSEEECLQRLLQAAYCNIDALVIKFDALGIDWPYSAHMKESLLILNSGANVDQLEI